MHHVLTEALMGADEMSALDRDLGIVEICSTCGREHDSKGPICVECWVAEQASPEYDADMDAYYMATGLVDEPLHYEIP